MPPTERVKGRFGYASMVGMDNLYLLKHRQRGWVTAAGDDVAYGPTDSGGQPADAELRQLAAEFERTYTGRRSTKEFAERALAQEGAVTVVPSSGATTCARCYCQCWCQRW